MKVPFICLFGLTAALFLGASVNACPQVGSSSQEQGQVTDDGKIKFTYQDADWQEVIPWFADQAGFTLQPVDDWPEGTFSLQDSEPYTVLEALDQLNHALRIHKPEAYTLIRNRKMLILARLDDANFPAELIETVPSEDLDQRGFYEVIKTRFDLGTLDAARIYEEMQPLIRDENRQAYALFPASNQLFVRETGEQLRNIRDLIELAKRRKAEQERDLITYKLKFQDPETFMAIAGPQLGIRGTDTVNEDGTLSISAEPLGDRLFVSGTQEMLKKFEAVAAKVDTDPNLDLGDLAVEETYLRQYPVMADSELAFAALQTMLEGKPGTKMQQDKTTGAILLMGTEEDHEIAQRVLGVISENPGDDFAIVRLEKADAAEALTILQTLLGQNAFSDEGGNEGPTLLADSYLNQIMVKGTVQEVASVKRMLDTIEANATDPLPPGPRTGTVMIPMDEDKKDRLAPMIPDLLSLVGRDNNPFTIVKPEDRAGLNERIRSGSMDAPMTEDPLGNLIIPTLPPRTQTSNKEDEGEERGRGDDRGRGREDDGRDDRGRRGRDTSFWKSINNDAVALTAFATGSMPTTAVLWQDEDDEDSGLTGDRQARDPNYQPPPQVQSVPGAPIQFKFTDYGLTITSKDLDAVDDIQRAIEDFMGEESSLQKPAFFYLQHRPVDEVKQLLEEFFGMADSGGGGGGGGGLMGGMMNNMLGGGGDLLGSLLDTGGGSGSGDIVLEGDVVFGMDPAFNGLWVRGATGNDLAQINQLIDVFDQPNGPIDPDLAGEFRTIDVVHRDATEMLPKIKEMLPELIFDPEAQKAAGGGNNNEMRQMMQVVQQLSRGGGGGGGGGNSADVEKMKPKAMLGVDELTNRLLVTGPDHIYQKIYQVVIGLDVPDISQPKSMEMVQGVSGDVDFLVQALRERFGSRQIQFDTDSQDNGSSGPGASGNTNPRSTSGSENPQQAAIEAAQQRAAAMMNMMRNQGATSGRRGGDSGGGRGGR